MMKYILFTLLFLIIAGAGISFASEGSPYCITHTYQEFGSPLFQSPLPMPGPPPDPKIGDSWDWYLWYFKGGPPHYQKKKCTVRGKGLYCYVIVDDAEWNKSMFQDDVDAIVNYFDNHSVGEYSDKGIYDLNTTNFGDPPDYDNLSRIFLVWYDIDAADGFFWWFDQYKDGQYEYASNECDCVYLDCVDSDPGGEYMNAVCAHEFEHMIHWRWDNNESAWVDEGCAELAMWLFGHPDTISGFNGNPDNDLTSWNGYYTDYIKVYLWTLYLFEHYGEYTGKKLMYTLVHEPDNSIQGVDKALEAVNAGRKFVDIFKDWVIANYLDDTTIYEGQYGYKTTDLPEFNEEATWDNYPIDWQDSTVNHWAGDYIKFISNDKWYNILLGFDGDDSTKYALRAIMKDGTSKTKIVDMKLDDSNNGTLNLLDFGYDFKTVVMVPEGVESYGNKSYKYSADAGGSDITLMNFNAKNVEDGVELLWNISSDESYYGFNLYRINIDKTYKNEISNNSGSQERSQEKILSTKVNDKIITGHNPFIYLDRDVKYGEEYGYILEVVVNSNDERTLGTANIKRSQYIPESFGVIKVYPNPTSESVNMLCEIPDNGDISVCVYDVSGRLVKSFSSFEMAGKREISFGVSELRSGVYKIVSKMDTTSVISNIIIQR
jgi:hypothetical protein